jgi:CheY-like chemotaxis protein
MSVSSGASRKVLVLDDSAEFCDLIRFYSAKEPIEVEILDTAEEGLERLKGPRFDTVLMDFHLPGMNGADAVRSLRRLEKQLKRPAVSVFAVTDLMDWDSGKQMLRAGCTALAGKPLSRQSFLDIARRG